ncbi:carbohydrate ABC transporter permease [Truepera radiovictrix]|uniref:Binding-protein-dependent transport systems inner membrane component n=1 Tax=Truepera radiovictrix (strain DSM 17093 / CIP 108686 / LMG 22925 / RQ-24) TaxID=649638 RepID=D7CUE1_TRURR|nr:sugar ABC transporter permease [Truepera radiovictrix]ADI15726.1 binding-protein-dependent transport systems inner membrane component [Truepera radiovictrix DSM 17093]WMT58648.1 sugar ABC transporter permease [Truepera radiovictrix]
MRSRWQTALLAFPALVVFGAFSVLPLLSVVRYATWRWSGVTEPVPVGLLNLARLVSDGALWRSLGTTLLFMFVALPAFLVLSVVIAMAIEGVRLERFVKALLFLPGLITVGGSAIAWYLLYNPDFGLVVELSGLALPWTTVPWAALLFVVLFTLWQQTGYGVLVTSASLRGIPREVKEAARIDGASEHQVRLHITLPLLKPTLLFLLVVGTVFALQSYTAVYLLTRGGPFGSTRVLGYYLYETAFERFELGYGAAVTLFVMLVTLAVASVQAKLLARRGGVEVQG